MLSDIKAVRSEISVSARKLSSESSQRKFPPELSSNKVNFFIGQGFPFYYFNLIGISRTGQYI
jgi:hypothetical protein